MSNGNGNGIKLPLVINSSMLFAGLVAIVTMWVQQGTMAEDISDLESSPVTEARVVAIETELKNLTEHVRELGEAQRDNTEEILDAIRGE